MPSALVQPLVAHRESACALKRGLWLAMVMTGLAVCNVGLETCDAVVVCGDIGSQTGMVVNKLCCVEYR